MNVNMDKFVSNVSGDERKSGFVSSASREDYEELVKRKKFYNDFYCASCEEHSVRKNKHIYPDGTRCRIFEAMSNLDNRIKETPEYKESMLIEK